MEFNPELDFKLLLAVPFIPLIGYVIQIFFGKSLPRKGDFLLTGGMAVVMAITVFMLAKAIWAGYHGHEFRHDSADIGMSFGWFYSQDSGGTNVVASLFYDSLGAAMLAVVGIVSFFVHLFSTGYMHGDRRYHIFFANISLFSVAMLGLVLSDNILFLFIFWEVMGLMSYLLIGHFSHDPTSPRIKQAAAACKKAFLTTRVGDVCLLIGFIMFYFGFSQHEAVDDALRWSFKFTHLWEAAAQVVQAEGGYPAWMTTAGLFTFGGTVGKSAQFPLHIWLPDAMEGPTPVSAMIHAATMVAAGVFLLGRTYPMMSPEVLQIVAAVGAFTALFAATIGTTVNDIKGVLAYSTISQLGFMVAAVGCGGVVAGMFHMVTHAFFKACLFLSAGSVIHGCHHNQDMRYMGGLRKMMPLTFAAMLISTLAISGIPLFSGFYSKDLVVAAAFENMFATTSGAGVFASVALPLAALLTAFYMFRLIFMTFFGEYRGADDPHAHHGDDHGDGHGHDDHGHGHVHVPHESPRPMTISLLSLAALGMLGGSFWLVNPFTPSDAHHRNGDWFLKSISLTSLYGEDVVAGIPHLALAHAAEEEAHSHHGDHGDHGGGHGDDAHGADSHGADSHDAGSHADDSHADDHSDDHSAVDTHADEHAAAGHAGGHSAQDVTRAADALHDSHVWAPIVSLLVAGGGILLAALLYFFKFFSPATITRRLGLVYAAVRDKYYIDEFVNATVIRAVSLLSKALKKFDELVVDGIVNGVGRINRSLGFVSAAFDRIVIDGIVNYMGLASQSAGAVVRLFQTGRVQQYAAFAVGGAMLLAAWVILV